MGLKLPAEAFRQPALGYKSSWLEIGFLSLSINILSLALPLITLQVYDRIIGYGQIGTLNILCLGVLVAIVLETALRMNRAYMMGWAGAVFEHTVATNAVRHKLQTQIQSHDTDRHDLQNMTAISKIRDFYSGQALATTIDLPFIFVFLVLIWYFAHSLVLVPLLFLGLLTVITYAIGVTLKSKLKWRNEADERRHGFLIRTLSNIHTVKAFGLEQLLERRYEVLQEDTSSANYSTTRLNTLIFDQGMFSSQLMMLAMAVAGAPLVLTGQITSGTLVACILLSGRIMQPLQKAMGVWIRVQDVNLAKQKIIEHFKCDTGASDRVFSSGQTEKKPIRSPAMLDGKIEINGLSYSENGQDKILQNINLQIKPGEVVAITGTPTSSAQILLKLMAGVFKPNDGTVKINGQFPHDFSSNELVRHIGYLPAHGTIFKGTIYDNISRFGRVQAPYVEHIIKLLRIDEDLSSFVSGHATRLEGSHTDAISPGLRQRIAIARAMAEKPHILLFDHADRALDKDGYNCLYSLLGRLKGSVTMVLLTHDQNILQLADRHFTLNNTLLIESSSIRLGGQNKQTSLGGLAL